MYQTIEDAYISWYNSTHLNEEAVPYMDELELKQWGLTKNSPVYKEIMREQGFEIDDEMIEVTKYTDEELEEIAKEWEDD